MATPVTKIRFREPQIEMAHGAGGKASRRLVEGLFAPLLFGSSPGPSGRRGAHSNQRNANRDDHRQFCGQSFAFSRRFDRRAGHQRHGERPGCVWREGRSDRCARYVLEAGLPTDILEAEVRAMGQAAEKAGVMIAGGDTKVVEHGKADRMYITTTGIGRLLSGVEISPQSVRPGDKVLLSGPIGDHGITILLARGELDLEADLRSDTRSVFPLVQALVSEAAQAFAGCAIPRVAAWPLR